MLWQRENGLRRARRKLRRGLPRKLPGKRLEPPKRALKNVHRKERNAPQQLHLSVPHDHGSRPLVTPALHSPKTFTRCTTVAFAPHADSSFRLNHALRPAKSSGACWIKT